MKRELRYLPLVIVIASVIALVACSTKKNTAASRFWQAFTTRYNVYYNGATNYDEQIKILENDYQDDYSQRLFIHPAEAYANPKATQPSGSFDRTIEKMQKAISLHSIKKKPQRKAGKGNDAKYKEWLKRDEYNPFIHNAWYMLAKAQYMKGDFLSSAATFHYISRHFTWMPDLVTESKLWEALNYCAMGWNTEADNILAHIHIDKIEDNKLKSLANLAFADYYIKEKRIEQAIPYLAEAVKGAKGGQKVRLNFLLGQLYEDIGDKQNAYLAYKKAGSSSSSTYRTHFNARIKQSAVFQGENIKSEVRSLKAMTRYDRNKEYLDQIYYAIGNLYLSRKDTVNAVENYLLAAKKSTRNGIEKAISQLALGGVYFAQRKYDLAQPCYSEAIPLLKEDYPNYKELKLRSDVLDELAVYAQNVNLQDSLLRLSKMTLEEQKAVIKKIIDELKKKEKEEADEAARQEYLANQSSKGSLLPNSKTAQPTTFGINNDDSWYFYNTATKNAGKTAFQQQWGNRKLEDHWRRRNKQTFALDEPSENATDSIAGAINPNDSTALAANDSTAVDQEKLKREQDPHYEEYYLKQIPKTEEEIQTAHDVIQEGLYNMGVILKDKLEDYPAAEYEFNELLTRYPDNIYRLDTYYNMYLMYMRNEEITKADKYRDLILTEFADSKYGQAMQDPNYLENLKTMEVRQEQMYAEAYANYLNNNNEAVHEAYAEMMRRYPLSKIMPKFMFIDALAYVTQKDYDKFKSTLKDMLERYPETDITPTASSIVKQLNQGRKPNGGGSNLRGMIWSMRLSNDSTAADIEKQFTPFTEGLDKPQVFVLVYSTDSVSPNQVLYEVARHNFGMFKTQDYDLELMSFGSLGMLIVKGFANYTELLHYRTAFEQDDDMNIPESAHQVLISEDNFNLLLSEGRTFEDYFNYLEHKNDEEVESQVPESDEEEEEEAEEEEETDTPRKSVKTSTSMPAKDDKKKEEKKKEDKKKEDKKADDKKKAEDKKETPKKDDGKKPDTGKKAEDKKTETTKKSETKPVVAESDTTKTPTTTIAKTDSIAKPVVDVPADTIKTVLPKPEEKEEERSEFRVDDIKDEFTKALQQGEVKQPQPDKPAAKTDSLEVESTPEINVNQPVVNDDKKTTPDVTKSVKQVKTDEKDVKKQQEQARKDEEKRRKEEEKRLKERQKFEQDSIKAEKKAQEKALKDEQKRKEQEAKDEKKAKEEAKKQKEKERKEQLKAKEEQRKQRAKEREQKRKEREKAKKEQEKQRKEAKKQKEKERKEAQKQKERERKQREKERKEAKKNNKK